MLDCEENSHVKADTVRLLIEHGADVTAQAVAYSTPLHLASSSGSAETVKLLIEHGADVTARDGNHRTPLHLASSRVSAETVRLLIQHALMLTDRTRGLLTDGSRSSKSHFVGRSPTTRLIQRSY